LDVLIFNSYFGCRLNNQLADLVVRLAHVTFTSASLGTKTSTLALATWRPRFVAGKAPRLEEHGNSDKRSATVKGHFAQRGILFVIRNILQAH
jgi:hypothetical protein